MKPEYEAAQDAFHKSYGAGNTTFQAVQDALHAYEEAKRRQQEIPQGSDDNDR